MANKILFLIIIILLLCAGLFLIKPIKDFIKTSTNNNYNNSSILNENKTSIGQCNDGTEFYKCNNKGELCNPPGILGLYPECESYKKTQKPYFQGSQKIAIVEFVAPNIKQWPEWGGYKFIDLLNNNEPSKYFGKTEPTIYSIRYVSKFFEDEAKKYGKSLDLDISIIGPYYLDEFPPLDPVKRNQQVYLNVTYLKDYAEQQGIDLNNFDKWIPLYLYNYYDLDGEEGTTLHPNSGAISFQIDTIQYPIADYIATIAHEIAHLYGTTDQYVSYSCKDPDGVPNPGTYPQSKACIMCPAIAIEKKGSTYGITDMSQVILCDKAAEELGWLE